MENVWPMVLLGIQNCFHLPNLFFMVGGTSLGVIVGALPGLSATTGMVLLLPLTYGLPIQAGLLMLAGVYCGALYGGSISAVLIGIPGTAAALATTFDGFPMTRQGKASEALLYALYASAFGGVISAFVLMFLTPVIAKWALKFGPPEIFALGLWGMTVVSSIVGQDIVKGLVMAILGLLVSTVGADPMEGYSRMTFGNFYLIGGFSFVPMVLGALAVPRVFDMAEKLNARGKEYFSSSGTRKFFLKPREILHYWVLLIKSAIIGVVVGIAPAAGPTIASFLSYNEAKRVSADPSSFGNGNREGVIASETANNGATGGSLVLALSIGIPGSAAAAILLGAVIMKGIQPGPMLLENNPETAFTFFAGFLFVNILVFILGHFFIQIGFSIIKMPIKILAPVIFVTCVLGAFSAENDIFNVYVMVIVGILAYLLGKMQFPMPPFILALILGPIMEANFWASYLISYGDYLIFFKRPLSMIFMIIAILTLLTPLLVKKKKRST
ncbi:MAG: tripartite tricarboxylate transporter permease [Synergistales bacterium]|nr:tripartite tricarboxylate transporter permease [Synergistales bacterium]